MASRRVSFNGDGGAYQEDGFDDEGASDGEGQDDAPQSEQDLYASEEYRARQVDILKERSEWELLMDSRAKKVKQGRAKAKKGKKKVQEVEILDFDEGDMGHRFTTHLDQVMMDYHLVKVKVKM